MKTKGAKPDDVLDASRLDEMLRAQSVAGSRSPRLDLSTIRLVKPGALVQLAAVCHALDHQGTRCTIVLPGDSVRTYLARSGWVQAVAHTVKFDPAAPDLVHSPLSRLRGSNAMLLEVTTVESTSALSDLLTRMVATMLRLRFSKNDAYDVAMAVSELCQNILDHTQRSRGFVAMQVYGRGDGQFVEIGVADYGVGIADTLRRNPTLTKIRNDEQAIRRAVELGTSQFTNDRTRGTGLYHLLELGTKHGGCVEIRSGACRIRYRLDKKKDWVFRSPSLPGVHVAMSLNAKKKA